MSGKQALAQARKLVRSLKGETKIIHQVLDLLKIAEKELERGLVTIEPVRRGKTPLTYVVEQTALGETVAEYRPKGSSQPFRCPKPVYDAMIDTLADAEKPLSAEEIAAAVEKKTGMRPADHQFRVPLRLWTQIASPLLARTRAKYHATDNRTFADRARALWNSLRKA